MSDYQQEDYYCPIASGVLFVRVWRPVVPLMGAPILLLHDSLGCVSLWRDFPARLCVVTARIVVAYDRLGFGESTARADVLPFDFIAEESSYWSFLQSFLGFKRFVVLGHSVGGGMALCGAARYVDACEAVISIAAQAFVEDRTVAGIRAAAVAFQATEQLIRLEKYHGIKAVWVLRAWVETWLHPQFATWSLLPLLPCVHCPVLVIHGEADEYGSNAHPHLIAAHCAGETQLALLAGCGHSPQRERTAQVLTLIQAFLAG